MATYGLEFYGANNQLIFDTNNYSGNSTLVIQNGHPTTLSNNSSLTIPSDAFLFARVNSGNLRLHFGGATGQNYAQVENLSGQSISYFYARQSASIGNITGGGDYGLEVYASNGSTVTFSTRRTDSVLRFFEIWDHETRTNNEYVYTGGPAGVYVSVGYAYFTTGIAVNQFFYDNSGGGQGIQYKGFLNTQLGSGSVPNKGPILLATIAS
tara:strand:+ start:1989 stop:2618 length:630 start_codon:yes stop_codon:yes gene_type:complete